MVLLQNWMKLCEFIGSESRGSMRNVCEYKKGGSIQDPCVSLRKLCVPCDTKNITLRTP